MMISIGADHRGYLYKQEIISHYNEIEWHDVGTHSDSRVDYPHFAQLVCQDVLQGRAERGILLCGSGIGMSIAANRYKGIYAGLCWSPAVATVARHDDAINLLAIPTDFVTSTMAKAIVDAWLKAVPQGGVYAERLKMLDDPSLGQSSD